MMKQKHLCISVFVIFVILIASSVKAVQQSTPHEQAKKILQVSNIKGGIIVHIDCGNGKVTAALRSSKEYLVHGLDADTNNVKKARVYIQSLESTDRFPQTCFVATNCHTSITWSTSLCPRIWAVSRWMR